VTTVLKPSRNRALVSAVDYHTAGEPFRIVTGGAPVPEGRSVADRRVEAALRLDSTRRLVVEEPRGHDGMYGCFLTPPDDDGAVLGALFFHLSGFSTACGHGTIALATWAADSGLVEQGTESFHIDVPSGRVAVELDWRPDGGVASVGFRNVPGFVHARGVSVQTTAGSYEVDIAFGGAFYASLPAAALGLSVERSCLARLVEAGRQIQAALDAVGAAHHEADPRLSGIYGVTFYEELGPVPEGLGQRSVTVFGDGQVDRSPCGSGTTARLALIDGEALATGAPLVHESVIGTRFTARVVGVHEEAGRREVLTEVRGSASLTGMHHFVLDPHDVLGEGFTLSSS
jgi:proline racemase